GHCCLRNSDVTRDAPLRFSVCISPSDLSDLIVCEFCCANSCPPAHRLWLPPRAAIFATWVARSPFTLHIAHVVEVRSKPEMIDVDASPVVAPMQDTHSIGYLPMRQNPCNTVCRVLSEGSECAISALIE